jgi:hypothetical protein
VDALTTWCERLGEEEFFMSIDGKWSAGEQLEHLRKSSQPLVMALKLPKLVIRLKVGRPNRETRSFASVIEKYLLKLATEELGTTKFFPDNHGKKSKLEIINDYRLITKKLAKAITAWKETDLDNYILPHPLLGKLTVREMLFFTIYHTRHHFNHLRDLHA